MKKLLLLSLLLSSAIGMTAASSGETAIETGFVDVEALGLEGRPTLSGGTIIVETENVVMSVVNNDEYGLYSTNINGCDHISVNGVIYALTDGITGSINGSASLSGGPMAGTIYNFSFKKDGWIVIPSRLSSNKNYYVFEGHFGENTMPWAYTLGMDLQSNIYPEFNSIGYTLPSDDLGYVDLKDVNLDDYTFGFDAIAWPIRIATDNPDASAAGTGTGAIVFPVYAEAGNYMVLGTGTKMNTCGFFFVDSDPKGSMPEVEIIYSGYDNDHGNTMVNGTNKIIDHRQNSFVFNILSEDEKTCEVSIFYDTFGDIIIPEIAYINDVAYKVTSIGNNAFYGCTRPTSVTIPNSVTSIGSSAFYGCSGLTSVAIPASVTSIGSSAFSDCTGLTSVTIPNSITSIDDFAFYRCTGLTSVTIPNSVTSIGRDVFWNCSNLKSIIIPNSVTLIDTGVFYGCTGLTSVTIPNSVTSIGSNAFSHCKIVFRGV